MDAVQHSNRLGYLIMPVYFLRLQVRIRTVVLRHSYVMIYVLVRNNTFSLSDDTETWRHNACLFFHLDRESQ